MKASYFSYQLQFKKPATTSRGSMHTHSVYYIKLSDGTKEAWGEAAPLPGLSIDDLENIEYHIAYCCNLMNEGLPITELPNESYPSVKFAFESAHFMLMQPQPMCLFDTPFYRGQQAIEINGLVWMADSQTMLQEAMQKLRDGYRCIKFKVGALDFDEECRMIEQVRKVANAFKLEIRLDANGAFKNDEVLEQLHELSRFEIHSIEQPIKPKQDEWMQEVCAKSPICIALDEDLIGREPNIAYLKSVCPTYIILKPTLLGGLDQSDKWISVANQANVGWWATSALESNIGLNAIAQWCSTKKLTMPQGLGTGSLYLNNVPSPLEIQGASLYTNALRGWNVSVIMPQ